MQISDYSLVSFVPLNIKEEESIELVLAHVDHAIQYGEDMEPKELVDPEEPDEDGEDGGGGGGGGAADSLAAMAAARSAAMAAASAAGPPR